MPPELNYTTHTVPVTTTNTYTFTPEQDYTIGTTATTTWTRYDPFEINFDNRPVQEALIKTLIQKELDKYMHKIYELITEHIKVDISEEEFMELLNQ